MLMQYITELLDLDVDSSLTGADQLSHSFVLAAAGSPVTGTIDAHKFNNKVRRIS